MPRRLPSGSLCFFVLALFLIAPLIAGTGEPTGGLPDVCTEDPDFPDDCVDQLGPIGQPPAPAPDEGFRNIVSPIVDPLLLLESSNAADGRLFVLNPLANRVRVLDPQNNLAVVADIPVCYRPSALAQNADGNEVLVACHASDAIGVIDTTTNLMVAEIQDRDAEGRPLLQEPMAMAVVGNLAYVASSQNHRVAVIDLSSREVPSYIDIPGEDPRSLTVTPNGEFLIVANFLAGNRTEVDMALNSHIFDPVNGVSGPVCAPLLEGTGANIIDEGHEDFMDTSHPSYPILAECYLFAHTFGTTTEIVLNPARPDHDLVVIRLSDQQIVFTTDSLPVDLGTLNYGVRFGAAGDRVYLATVHAQNYLNHSFGNRPMLNFLTVLGLDAQTGVLSVQSIQDLDDPFLDQNGEGTAVAATPYAVEIEGNRVLIAAAGSDRLVVTDLDGNVTGSIPVGFTPKGVVATGDTAYVYNSTGLTVSVVDLSSGQQVATASIGRNPMPQSVRIGAHLMNSAHFASNGTFSCASCHPDGHLDGLVWQLNSDDGLRSTMTMQEISETGPFHWDGAKCNLAKILIDGITGLFQNPAGPSDCEMKTSIDFIESMVRPHTPFRTPDDGMTEEAKLGLGVTHRGRFKALDDEEMSCTGREQDPAIESKYLEAVADPFQQVLVYNGGGGPIAGTGGNETCATSTCHVTPHWAAGGGLFEAVSLLGIWDRPMTMHHGLPMRAKFVEALEINRVFHNAPSMDPDGHVTGKVAAHGFMDGHFRHAELNFDANPGSHAFTLTDAITRFMMEEEQLQAGAVGLSLVLDVDNTNDADNNALLGFLQSSADQEKVAFLGVGLIGGTLRSLTWDPAQGHFSVDDGGTLTIQQLKDSLIAGDSVLLYGALLPAQGSEPDPKLKALSRGTAPILCSEAYAEYHASLEIGETDASILLKGIDVVPGSRVMIDGQVTGAPLSGPGPDFNWTLPQAPATPAILAVQVLSPTGMQSNSISLPVVSPPVPAVEPQDVSGGKREFSRLDLRWPDQFGITGPVTSYDVFRGNLEDLAATGLTTGRCFDSVLTTPLSGDLELPDPGKGFYYVVRAQTQLNVTTWGSATRDAQAAASDFPCPVLFP